MTKKKKKNCFQLDQGFVSSVCGAYTKEMLEHVAPFGLGTALNWLKQSMKMHLFVQRKLCKEGIVYLCRVCSACGSWPPNTTNVAQLKY